MAPLADAERITGYVAGGISPFGGRRQLPTVLDASATGFDRIYVSGGKRGLDLGLSPKLLVELLGATVAAVARWS
jgi:Cys-tRNA(Pro)/Cys-tRNA(Cys) deacylase